MEQNNRLSVRDFVLIGVLNAVAHAFFFIFGSVIGSTPIGWLFTYAVLAVPLGIIYILLYSKVRKNFVVLISGLVACAIMLINFWLVPAVLTFFVICNEIIWRIGRKRFWAMAIAHCVLMTGWSVAAFLPLIVMKNQFISQYGDAFRPYFESVYQTLAGPMFFIVIAATIAGSLLGSFLGRLLLKKNFEKAGIV